MRNCRFLPGQLLFKEGDPSDCAYIIRSGRVEVTKNTVDGPLRLAMIGKNEVLGEMGLVEERPRSATARALDAVVADAVNPGEFHALVLNKPEEAIAFIRTLMERLRSMNRAVVQEHQARQ
jgi:CRP-like cAMP-binding protein